MKKQTKTEKLKAIYDFSSKCFFDATCSLVPLMDALKKQEQTKEVQFVLSLIQNSINNYSKISEMAKETK